MYIYDSTSLAFIKKSEQFLREILTKAGISVRRNRFEINHYLYPIRVVVFEGPEWGHFNSSYLQIALNKKLIFQAKDSVVRDILMHELAHYLTHIFYRDTAPHGKEFQAICEKFGFPKVVSQASLNLEAGNLSKEGDLESEKVLEKVKKLLSLAQSSNAHEAELATIKANDLLLRHSLKYINKEDEPIYMVRILIRKRKDAKLSAIYSILKHFIVRPVISQGQNTCCLEVSGSLTNVKLASYVAGFLDHELESLWYEAKKTHHLKGIKARNSFLAGIAQGYDLKMKQSKMSYSDSDQKALMVVEKNLDQQVAHIYGRLSSSRSHQQTDFMANLAGKEKGQSLTIRNALEGVKQNLYLPTSTN